jgi:hypothetical protein
MSKIESQLLSAIDAMSYLGIKRKKFYKLVGMGFIPIHQPDPSIRPMYWKQDLDNYIRSHRHTVGYNI